jgi:hypothetical protein
MLVWADLLLPFGIGYAREVCLYAGLPRFRLGRERASGGIRDRA